MGKYHGLVGRDQVLSMSVSTMSSKWEASGQVPNRAVQSGRIKRFGAIDATEGGNTSRTNANLQLLKSFSNGDFLKTRCTMCVTSFNCSPISLFSCMTR